MLRPVRSHHGGRVHRADKLQAAPRRPGAAPPKSGRAQARLVAETGPIVDAHPASPGAPHGSGLAARLARIVDGMATRPRCGTVSRQIRTRMRRSVEVPKLGASCPRPPPQRPLTERFLCDLPPRAGNPCPHRAPADRHFSGRNHGARAARGMPPGMNDPARDRLARPHFSRNSIPLAFIAAPNRLR